MEEIQKMVAAMAEAFADYEEAIQTFQKAEMRRLCQIVTVNTSMGYLESDRIASDFESMVARHRAETFAMHEALTKRAQELGIDLPQTRGGGDR